MNKRIFKNIISSLLAVCIVGTSCFVPTTPITLELDSSEVYNIVEAETNTEVVQEAFTQAVTETTTQVENTTSEETTKKKSTYTAKKNVVTEKASGDKKKDEDKGSDKVIDNSLIENNNVSDKDKIEEHVDNNKPSDHVKPDVQSSDFWEAKNINYQFANTSNAVGWKQYGNNMYYLDYNHQPLKGLQKIGGNDKRNYYFNEYGAKASLVGIDVSRHNGNIDWNKVKNDGIDYAIIRVGFRGYGTSTPYKPVKIDDKFEQNMAGAKAAGIPVGIYFYSQAINVDEAMEEAGACIQYAKQYDVKLPIYFDTEFACGDRSGRADKLTRSERTEIAVAFCESIKNAGYTPGVYASKSFFYDNLDYSRLKGYQIWVAHYTQGKTDFKHDYRMWQYTSNGTVNGISGKTDLNISLYDYVNKSDMTNKGKNTLLLNNDEFNLYTTIDKLLTDLKNNKTDENITKVKQFIDSVSNAKVKEAFTKSYDEII